MASDREPGIGRNPSSALPEALRRFILTSVPSVPFVEALLLFRNDPDAARDAASVARHLYISVPAAAEVVAQLVDARIVLRAEEGLDVYRYHPETSALAHMLDTLSTFYSTNLVEVTDLIHSRRKRTANHFADAFKLRREP